MSLETKLDNAGTKILNRVPGAALIAVAAAMWGLDGLLRRPLTKELSSGTIVFTEHLILTLCVLPLIPRAFRSAKANLDWRGWLAVIFVGAGASAVATIMFTEAFAHSFALADGGITPLLLQKFQPFIAVLAAAIILKERLHKRFWVFFIAGVASGYLLTFGWTKDIQVQSAKVTTLALGAAVLWAMGTVLGRYLSLRMKFEEIATLRFTVGLIACAFILPWTHSSAVAPAGDYLPLIGVALISGGLFALMLYYLGMQRTPASVATLAELTYPVTAAVVGVAFLGGSLTTAQWVGAACLMTTVTLLGYFSARSSEKVGVDESAELEVAKAFSNEMALARD